MPTKPGPKAPVSLEPLDWSTRAKGLRQFELFCKRYLIVPRGKGAGKPFKPRPWQLEMLESVFNEDAAHTSVFVLPRGNGKSGLIAAVALHHLFMWGDGARVLVAAQNEQAAKRLLSTAQAMIQKHPELEARAKLYKDRIEVPGSNSSFIAVASELNAIEGEDLSLAIIDEIGQTGRDVFESALLSTGKRPGTKMVAIGTPSTPLMRDKSPLLDLVKSAKAGDKAVHLVEYGADSKADILSPETWKAANPAYGDWLTEATFRSVLPPKTREAEFRRARLGQWIEQTGESYIPAEDWHACGREGVKIPPGSKVVLALDGSRRWDATVVMVASVSKVPHLQLGGFWFNADRDEHFQVNHQEVEQRILDLARIYRVEEVIADPAYWSRSLQVLESEGLNVGQFPQNGSRMPKALQEFLSAVLGRKLTHSADVKVNKHVIAAQITEGGHGIKLAKPGATTHIDAAVAAVMAYNRAFWLGGGKQRKRIRSYKR